MGQKNHILKKDFQKNSKELSKNIQQNIKKTNFLITSHQNNGQKCNMLGLKIGDKSKNIPLFLMKIEK